MIDGFFLGNVFFLLMYGFIAEIQLIYQSTILLKAKKHYNAAMQKSKSTTLADFKSLPASFPQSHPPLSFFFLSVNMSGEEHKKGRVSELEGQQQASGRAMFLLSGPQREGEKEGKREHKGSKGGMEQSVFFLACQGNHEGRVLGPSRPGLFTSTAFSEEVHSLERWPPLPCHPRQEGKQGRRRRGSMYALLREGA